MPDCLRGFGIIDWVVVVVPELICRHTSFRYISRMIVLAHHPPSMSPLSLMITLFIPGHADMTKYEWATNQHRDTMASHVGHYDQLSYYAVAQNESVGRVRAQMLEKMLEPCGPPPTKKKQQEN